MKITRISRLRPITLFWKKVPYILKKPILAKFRLRYTRLLEPHVIKLFKVPKDAIVLDVGAFVGFYSRLAAKQAKKGLILAIEPEPYNFRLLRINTKGFSNVILLDIACWSENKYVKLYIRGPSTHSIIKFSDKFVIVRALTIDYLVFKIFRLPRVDLIKIDVEGAEYEVLKGAISTLESFKPVLFIEIWKSNVRSVLNFLYRLGYKRFRVIDGVYYIRSW